MKLKRCNTHYTIFNFTQFSYLSQNHRKNRHMHIRSMKHIKWKHFYTYKSS